MGTNGLTANEYQFGASVTALYPGRGTAQGLVYTILGLAGEAGEVANQVKKILRDDDGVLTDERKAKLVDEMSDVCWYAAMACDELGVDLGDVMTANLSKLASRAERGTIQGSGDGR